MTLEPGETTQLHMAADLRARFGPQRLSCFLAEDNGTQWLFELETVVYRRSYFPGHLVIHFGMVDPSSEMEKTVEFYCHARTEDALPVDMDFTVASPHVSVAAQSGRTEKTVDGIYVRKVPLRLRVKAPAEAGAGATNLTAHFRYEGKPYSHVVGVDWYVRPLLTTQPSQVYFTAQDRDGGIPVTRKVVLKRTDSQPLIIKAVVVPHAGITCETQPLPGGAALLLFTCDPSKTGDFLAGDAVIETDHAVQKTVRVPIAVAPR